MIGCARRRFGVPVAVRPARGKTVEQKDLERIARATLREVGEPRAELRIAEVDGQPGHWRIDIGGARGGPNALRIRCSRGTTAQWVREQIFNAYVGA